MSSRVVLCREFHESAQLLKEGQRRSAHRGRLESLVRLESSLRGGIGVARMV